MAKFMNRFGLLLVLALMTVLVVPGAGLAFYDGSHSWDYNEGKMIVSRTSPYTLGDCQVVSDGDGGAFFVFLDITDLTPGSFSAVLRAGRYDHEGNCVLSFCLVRIPEFCVENDYRHFATVSDGFGGVIVAWIGESNGETKVLAQRITSDGARPWGNEGVVLSTHLGSIDVQPHVCPDKLGGAFVGWGSRVVQVMEDGTVDPGVDGIEFIPGGGTLLSLIADGTGGFIPWPFTGSWEAGGLFGAWADSSGKVFAKRIRTGITWAPVQVTQHQTFNGLDLALADTASLVVTSYGDDPGLLGGTVHLVKAQKLDGNGNRLWGTNGVTVVSSQSVGGEPTAPVVTKDGAGGAIVAWNDSRAGNLDVYAQRISASGVPVWTGNGVYVSKHWLPGGSPALANQWNPKIVSDLFGGAVITYDDLGGWDQDISATRLDGNGNAIWSQWIKWDGTSFDDPGYRQHLYGIAFDGSGPLYKGAIILWREDPSYFHRYYAQKVVIDNTPPENDDSENAKAITDGQNMFYRYLFRATNDGTATCGSPGQPDVWFKYTAAKTGLLKVNTCRTNALGGTDNGMDSVLSIHTASPGTQANELDCNDNWDTACVGKDAGLKRDSAVEVPIDAGETVLIRVSMNSEHVPGNFLLSVALDPDSQACKGNFDGDGDVDGSDLAVFAADFGRTDCGSPPPCEGDFDGDGDVDGSDLATFAADFGRTDCQ